MIRCTCCQAELTAPQFFNGFPYGYTCVRKVDPQFKRTKTVYVAAEKFAVVSGEGTSRQVINVIINGTRKQIVAYGMENNRSSCTLLQNGVLYVSESVLK